MLSQRNLLTDFLEQAASDHPQSVAIEDSTIRLTFADMRDRALRVAYLLKEQGVARGDHVVLCMSNSAGFCAAFWGTLYAGAVAVPLNTDTKTAKLAFVLGDCAATAVILDADQSAKITQALQVTASGAAMISFGTGTSFSAALEGNGDLGATAPAIVLDQDLATIIYTSGSTGRPKGVMLSHLNMVSAARSVAQYLGYHDSDRIFCAIPMSFDYGLHQLTMATLVGACLLVEPSFARPLFALQRLATSHATVFPMVPTMVPLIAPLAARYDFSAVRCISSTAAALHAPFIDQLETIFPNATVFSMYGLTECHRCTYLDPTELTRRRTSVGKAIPNTELWVVDAEGNTHRRNATGELVIRGSTVMKGYLNNPEQSAEKLRPGPMPGEQVLYTGDTCRLDAEGFVYFISRSDDILKVAGEKVAPSEVETALIAHPDVSEVCALGMEHPVYGQQCCAVVSGPDGSSPDSAAALKRWCTDRLEAHVVPARILVVDALARNGNGKIDRQILREWLEAGTSSSRQPDVTIQPRAEPVPS
ncbi:long-chain-fatty-acid- CoA ligase IcfB [Phaeobacter piscinae]|uniref:Long-chain-fatty-acid-CoA ligase IcfB n=1 Tax=Phaeobacter piscinae TaxID=1580596 RepID=A0ABM6PCK6_9RHOB|nr:class I adenylate-forming enzyme family protein [Phaeobacter piscinae]ATG35442.1 long-chain-fatty-acid- CoA ligase IcfB [Phaeobacter piscinae]AUQ85962.1 long-chain-fatty-acid- CoA ligase IcfB [Phaeobacter piscinae]AUR23846.1 long-chain-fatty-acid- CoA ligase IcfB [Phaeobacter piscinae]